MYCLILPQLQEELAEKYGLGEPVAANMIYTKYRCDKSSRFVQMILAQNWFHLFGSLRTADSERVKKLRMISFSLQSCRHRLPLLQVHQVINQIFNITITTTTTTIFTIILIVDIMIQMWCKSSWSWSLPPSSSRHQRWT